MEDDPTIFKFPERNLIFIKTQGSETSQYLEEKKSMENSLVVVSESE